MSLNGNEARDFEGVVQLIRDSADSAKHAHLVKFDDNVFWGAKPPMLLRLLPFSHLHCLLLYLRSGCCHELLKPSQRRKHKSGGQQEKTR